MIGSGNPYGKQTRTGLLRLNPVDVFGREKTLAECIADFLTPAPSSPPTSRYNALAGLLTPAPEPAPKPYNYLTGLLSPASIGSPVLRAYGLSPAPALRPIPAPTVAPPVRRKVFFSFYYQGDIRRSCIVRNCYMFRKGSKPPSASFYDRSLWEKSKRESEESLKSLIRQGMAETSVTCILAGTETWSRPWVRFEIAHSLFRCNGFFTCYIHSVNDPHLGMAEPGYDPLWFMGLELRPDGRGNVVELIDNEWWHFEAMKRPVPWPTWMPKPSVGRLFRLSDYTRAYDYTLDDGHENLCHWAQEAAHAARRR